MTVAISFVLLGLGAILLVAAFSENPNPMDVINRIRGTA